MQNKNLTRGRRIALANVIRETLRLSNWHDGQARELSGRSQHRSAATAAGTFAQRATSLASEVDSHSLDEFIAELAAANELLSNPTPSRDLVDSVWLRLSHAETLIRLASPYR